MTRFTRRVFIKRGGAATLGSVLGLGLLPSLTRKLHATDQSGGDPRNVKLTYDEAAKTQSWQYLGGTLTISIQLVSSPESGVCSGTAVMGVSRTAIYTKASPRATYTASYSEIANVIWQCIGGVATATSVTHPTPPMHCQMTLAISE